MLFAECTVLLLPLDVVRARLRAAACAGSSLLRPARLPAGRLTSCLPIHPSPPSTLQGNRAGVVGCGFWNNNCGGLDIALVWQIVYCIIAGLIVVVFPFFIFYYENDDEGMSAEEESGGSCFARLCNFGNCKRSLGVAFSYTLVTTAISALVVWLCYNYLKTTEIPYKLTSIGVDTVAFQPGACLAGRGRGRAGVGTLGAAAPFGQCAARGSTAAAVGGTRNTIASLCGRTMR
jgi:hypothetical protein